MNTFLKSWINIENSNKIFKPEQILQFQTFILRLPWAVLTCSTMRLVFSMFYMNIPLHGCGSGSIVDELVSTMSGYMDDQVVWMIRW